MNLNKVSKFQKINVCYVISYKAVVPYDLFVVVELLHFAISSLPGKYTTEITDSGV